MISQYDDLLEDDIQKAIKIAKECKGTNKFSITLINQIFRKGYIWAEKVMEELEERGVVGPYNGRSYREVL